MWAKKETSLMPLSVNFSMRLAIFTTWFQYTEATTTFASSSSPSMLFYSKVLNWRVMWKPVLLLLMVSLVQVKGRPTGRVFLVTANGRTFIVKTSPNAGLQISAFHWPNLVKSVYKIVWVFLARPSLCIKGRVALGGFFIIFSFKDEKTRFQDFIIAVV